MTGAWLERLGRRGLRPRQFERLLSPALADLQHEAGATTVRTARAYAGAWRALLAALAIDAALDVRATLGAAADWRDRLIAAGFVLLLTATFTWATWPAPLPSLGLDGITAVLTYRLPYALFTALPWFTVPAALLVTRRRDRVWAGLLLTAAACAAVGALGPRITPRSQGDAARRSSAALWRAAHLGADHGAATLDNVIGTIFDAVPTTPAGGPPAAPAARRLAGLKGVLLPFALLPLGVIAGRTRRVHPGLAMLVIFAAWLAMIRGLAFADGLDLLPIALRGVYDVVTAATLTLVLLPVSWWLNQDRCFVEARG